MEIITKINPHAEEGSSNKIPTPSPYHNQVDGAHYQNKHDLAQFCIENEVHTGEFSVMKYAYRHASKGGIIDLRKAHQWLQFLAYSVYGEEL